MKKRIASIALSLAMCLTLLPTAAYAEDVSEWGAFDSQSSTGNGAATVAGSNEAVGTTKNTVVPTNEDVEESENYEEKEKLDFRFSDSQPSVETTYTIKNTVGSGTATWIPAMDGGSNKLILNNVKINNSTTQLVGVPANTEIVLVGENELSGFESVMQAFAGDLKIKGNGSLKVVSNSSGNAALCTSISGAVDVNIDGKLEVTGAIRPYNSGITLRASSIDVTGSVQTNDGATTLTSTAGGVQITEYVRGKGVSIVSAKDITIGKTVSTADISATISLTAQDGDLTVQKVSGDYGTTPVTLFASDNLKVLGVSSDGVYAGTLSLSGTIPEGTVLEPYVSEVVIPENGILYNNGTISIHSRGSATVTVAGTLHVGENSVIDNGYGTTITPNTTGNGVIVAPPASELDFSNKTENSEGTGYKWDHANKTLTLTNYNSESVKGIVLPDGATLVLEGSNTIKASNDTVIQAKGSLTISGNGSLQGTTERSVGLDAAGAVTITDCTLNLTVNGTHGTAIQTNENALTINGTADVSLNCTDSNAGWGINTGSGGNFELGSDAKLKITAPVGILLRTADVKLNGTLDTTNCASLCANLLTATLDMSGSSITMKEGTHIWLYQKTDSLTGTDKIKAFSGKLQVATGNGSAVDYYKVKVNDTLALYAVGSSLSFTAEDSQNGKTFTGWSATGVTLSDASNKTISFIMPDNDVILTANWASNSSSSGGGGSTPRYAVTTPDKTENGSLSVNPKNAKKGSDVTITVTPDKGYEVDEIVAKDANGNKLKLKDNGDGTYTFTMPGSKVTVTATFAEKKAEEPVAPEKLFADVSVDDYYYEAVKWASENGVTGGIGENLFGAKLPCTRAQIVTFLWRAAGSPEPKGMSGFVDVSADAYYAKAVAWAVEEGIVSGTSATTFSPDAVCTRAQSVAFLYRAFGEKVNKAAGFSDVSANAYYADAVAWAVENGVASGIGGGLFAPDQNCARGQIVAFLYRAYQNK